MRNLLHCRRGSVAFALVVAAIPVIGALALGGEAGTWYVTKRHAQNAADVAAYSGGLRLACAIGAQNGTACADAQSVAYRGKQFAAQNTFCNAGDSSYPGSQCPTSLSSGVSRTVTIESGASLAGPWSAVMPPPAGATFVRATVAQTQPAYLAAVLGLSTINIGAQAIAKVQVLANPCILALTGSISFQGSPNINAPGCGMASNDSAKDAINFTGGGMTINVGSLSAAGGCTGSATYCNTALTYMPPVTNPFAALDGVTLPTLPNCSGSSLTAYSASTPCKNNNVTLTGNTTISLAGGVYLISGTLTLKGTTGISGTGLFILLSGASFDMKGTGRINITGNASVTSSQLPVALQPYAGLFANMAIYDRSTVPVTIGGNSNISFAGNMYFPQAAVTFQGNPTINASACGNQLIASSLAFNGNPTLNFDFKNTGCSASTKPSSQFVSLVQ